MTANLMPDRRLLVGCPERRNVKIVEYGAKIRAVTVSHQSVFRKAYLIDVQGVLGE